MPGKAWDNINDRDTLLKALKKTRQDVCISFPEPFDGQIIVGGLILANGYPPAAIGYGIQGNDPGGALELTAMTVKQIEKNLEPHKIYY